MSRAARCGWLGALLMVAGCTRDEAYFEVAREQRAASQEVVDILASVTDEKSMAAAQAAILERRPKIEAITRRAKALPRPSDEVQARLKEEAYMRDTILKRMAAEAKRIQQLPGGPEFLEQFSSNSPGIMSAVQK